MPLYTFQHPKTEETIDVYMSMNDKHEYVDKDGVEWRRVFYAPNASIDTEWNPESAADFTNKTAQKKGTLGDIFDKSKELSEKRAKIYGGEDPKKKAFYKNYAKENGIRHSSEIQEKRKKFLEKPIEIDIGKFKKK